MKLDQTCRVQELKDTTDGWTQMSVEYVCVHCH